MLQTFIGVDPGLVDSGFVVMTLNQAAREISITYHVHSGEHPERLLKSLLRQHWDDDPVVYIEDYVSRATSMSTDPRMREVVSAMKRVAPQAYVIGNMGSKKIVRQPLMDVLGLNKFPTTNHRDLEAAARIMVFGMLKHQAYNVLITEILVDHINKEPWKIIRVQV